MTKQEFLNSFYLQYDEIADLSAPGFTPLELSNIVSKVQEDLAVSKYGSKSNKMQEGFEETEKRIQDLGELVEYKTYSTFSPGFFDNSVEIVLPNTLITVGPTNFTDVFWFSIYEQVKIDLIDCTKPASPVVYVKPKVIDVVHGELNVALVDPFRRPYAKADEGKVLRLRGDGRKHILLTDGTFNITEYKLGYVKKPTPIDLTTGLTSQVSQLSDSVHRELLEMTIAYCFKSTKQFDAMGVEIQTSKE